VTPRRSGADEGGQAFGSSWAPRRVTPFEAASGSSPVLEEEALFDGRLSGPGKRWNRHGFERGSGLGDDLGNGSPRQESQRFGRSPTCERTMLASSTGETIRRSEIGGVNHRYPWSDPRGQPRRFGASGIERSPGAKQAFTENGRGAGAHDEWSMAESGRTCRA